MLAEAIVSILLVISVASIKVAFIQNVTLVPISDSYNTTITNGTYFDCVCLLVSSSYAALNCLSNYTCRFFTIFPLRYQLLQTPETFLYFPNQSVPNPSQCCMSDISLLLNKLANSTVTNINVSSPRSVLFDNESSLSTVSCQLASLYRFNVSNLGLINCTSTFSSNAASNAFHNGAYYVGLGNNYIVIVDSSSGALLNSVTSSFLNGPRDIMFLDYGQTMVVTSVNNNFLVFFNRTNTAPVNYTFIYYQLVSYSNPHGLWRVNDTMFYATSWSQKRLYSYSSVNSSYWKETLIIDAGATVINNGGGNHVTVDECDRRWFTVGSAGALIYDKNGVLLGTYSPPLTGDCFDVLFLDNYVMYVSDFASNKITRIDPDVVC